MKVKLLTVVILITSALSFNLQAHKNNADENINNELPVGLETEAAQVVTQFHKALRNQNSDLVRSLLSKDVLIFESGKAERSAEEYASGHMKADMNYLASISSELIEHQVKVFGDVAVSTARFKNTRSVAGRNRVTISLESIVVSKINNKWLITHIHWS